MVFQFYSSPCETLHPSPPHLLGENHCRSRGAGTFSCSCFEIFTQCSDGHFPKYPGGWESQWFQVLRKLVWLFSYWCSSDDLDFAPRVDKSQLPPSSITSRGGLRVLGWGLGTWCMRLVSSVPQNPGSSLTELTAGAIPVSPSKSRFLPFSAHTRVRSLYQAELAPRWYVDQGRSCTQQNEDPSQANPVSPLVFTIAQPSVHGHLQGGQNQP